METLVQAVMDRLFIPLEASGRHVHLTRETAMTLFGHSLTPQRPLSQPGQFLAKERLTILGEKGRFTNVAVLGPERNVNQVEISLTDGRTLGLNPPVRLSGQVQGSPGITLEGPLGRVTLPEGVIVARRHVHLTPERAEKLGVADRQQVRLQVYTERPLIFQDVTVRVSREFADYAHLDYDEANACGFTPGDLGRILPQGGEEL